MSKNESARSIQLDVLRGIAILLVLYHHAPVGGDQAGFLSFLDPLQHFGWVGVDLFLVLSGFLIGSILMNEVAAYGSIDIGRFILRRGFKIWPGYYSLIIVAWLHQARHDRVSISSLFPQYLPNLLHYQNYFLSVWGTARSHTWSLSLEEHFYSGLVVLLAVLASWRREGGGNHLDLVPRICIALTLVCLALRVITVVTAENPDLLVEYTKATHLRIDSLFFGVMIAYFYRFHPRVLEKLAERRSLVVGMGLVLVLSLIPFTASVFKTTIGFSLLFVGFGCLLTACLYTAPGSNSWGGRFFSSRFARMLGFVGFYSYSIYLWHQEFPQPVVAYWIVPHIPVTLRWFVGNLVYLVFAIGLGVVCAKLIEMPCLFLRNRWFPARSNAINESNQS